MSFTALRASARRTTASAARLSPRVAVRNAALRRYATESAPPPPPKSSNAALFGALGAAALAGGAFYVFSSSDSAAEASSKPGIHTANYVPTKEDYQRVSASSCLLTLDVSSRCVLQRGRTGTAVLTQRPRRCTTALQKSSTRRLIRTTTVRVALPLVPAIGSWEYRAHAPDILGYSQMARTVPSSSVSPGTRRARTTRRPKLAAGRILSGLSPVLFASADTGSRISAHPLQFSFKNVTSCMARLRERTNAAITRRCVLTPSPSTARTTA